jgi:uncharacterized protein (TIGR02145 family)
MKRVVLVFLIIFPMFLKGQYKYEFHGQTYYEFAGYDELNGMYSPRYNNTGYVNSPGYILINKNKVLIKFLNGDEMNIELKDYKEENEKKVYKGVSEKKDIIELIIEKNNSEKILGLKYSEYKIEAYINPFKSEFTNSAFEFMIIFWFSRYTEIKEFDEKSKVDANKLNVNNSDFQQKYDTLNGIITIIDKRDSIKYKVIKIEKKMWFAENLKSIKYNDGTEILNVTSDEEWKNLHYGAFAWYNNNLENKNKYGALYNWNAVNSGKLCPVGWRVPSKNEWRELSNYIENKSIIDNNNEKISLNDFFGVGGYRSYAGEFKEYDKTGYWWSSTERSPGAAFFNYFVLSNNSLSTFGSGDKEPGYFVRCILDL